MKIYRYSGNGKGVPGLPHRLTEADVQRLGVETLLADALKAHQFEIIDDKSKTATVRPAVMKQEEKTDESPTRSGRRKSVKRPDKRDDKEA